MSDSRNLFTPKVVDEIERRFAVVPAFARPTLWEHATLPEYAALRSWLEGELNRVPESVRATFVSRLTREERYTAALAELATGYVLRQPGYTVEFERKFEGLTPDILVTDQTGRRLIIEVWRRGLPVDATAHNSRWMELARRLRRIRVPVTLAVEALTSDLAEPPDVAARIKIESAIRKWLSSGVSAAPVIEVEGLRFVPIGPASGDRTELVPVRTGSAANRKLVLEAIDKKVRRYGRLVEQLELPFVVVLSADGETGLDRTLVDSVLAGKNSVSISIPVFGVGAIEAGPVTLLPDETPPSFDPALSGVAWLDVNDGVDAVLSGFWPSPAARWPVERIEFPRGGRIVRSDVAALSPADQEGMT